MLGRRFCLYLRFLLTVNPRCPDPRPLMSLSHPSTTRNLLFAHPFIHPKFIPIFCGLWRLRGPLPDFTSFFAFPSCTARVSRGVRQTLPQSDLRPPQHSFRSHNNRSSTSSSTLPQPALRAFSTLGLPLVGALAEMPTAAVFRHYLNQP